MVPWRGYLWAFLVVLVGAALGAIWRMLEWVSPGLEQSGFPVLVLTFAGLGAVAQRWLSPGMTAALAAAALTGHLLAIINSTEGDEEHYGREPLTMLIVAIVPIGIAVGTALLAHGVVGNLRARAARPSGPERP